jgi:lysine-specific demethylase 3
MRNEFEKCIKRVKQLDSNAQLLKQEDNATPYVKLERRVPTINEEPRRVVASGHEWFGDDKNDNKFLVIKNSATFSESQYSSLFEEEWNNQRPILIRNLHKNLTESIWSPKSFNKDFGHLHVDLINCRNRKLVPDVSMQDFWTGFSDLQSGMRCEKTDQPLILKLKDWPTSADFKQLLPTRFDDLMKNLPMRKYSHRDGAFNMASNLPAYFSTPDLGPKMYIAYSSIDTPRAGTTNLHVDISDAVNLLIYVSTQEDDKAKVLKILEDTKCSEEQIKRFGKGEKIGAIWHLFRPRDADKIRSYFQMVSSV